MEKPSTREAGETAAAMDKVRPRRDLLPEAGANLPANHASAPLAGMGLGRVRGLAHDLPALPALGHVV